MLVIATLNAITIATTVAALSSSLLLSLFFMTEGTFVQFCSESYQCINHCVSFLGLSYKVPKARHPNQRNALSHTSGARSGCCCSLQWLQGGPCPCIPSFWCWQAFLVDDHSSPSVVNWPSFAPVCPLCMSISVSKFTL